MPISQLQAFQMPMLSRETSFEATRAAFQWDIPEHYNIGVDICDKWANIEPDRVAIIKIEDDNSATEVTFGEMKERSNRLANALATLGVQRGDRVGVLLPQMPETPISHIAAYKLGAIAIPLFMLFGADALEHRLKDSSAKVIVTEPVGVEKLALIRDRLPDLEHIIVVGGQAGGNHLAFETLLVDASPAFEPVNTRADDPALIIYTSGTTGLPKGALHAHRTLLGHLPGVELTHEFFPQPDDRMWTPADWAWIGGLINVLFPSLHHGVPVVAKRFEKFTGEDAFQLIEDFKIRNTFLPPTALKLMRAVEDPASRWRLDMRTIGSGGETLGAELLEWGREVFDLTINEFYGQTECNLVVGSCSALMAAKPGVMGKAVPGHEVDVINSVGEPCANGEQGNLAVRAGDPVMFLGYWNNQQATEEKYINDWLVTGDTGEKLKDGWFRFVGRDDDVITSSGYRIGPGEIEDCLIRHEAVRMAGVIGKPDALRGQIVKAFVVLNEAFEASDALGEEISSHVKLNLAAHEYPREVEFVDELPMTTTGKIIRRKLRQS